MTWKRGLWRLWIVGSCLWILLCLALTGSIAYETFDGDFRVLMPNFGSAPEEPETLGAKEEDVRAYAAELIGVTPAELKNMDRAERDRRAALWLNDRASETPDKELSDDSLFKTAFIDIFGEFWALEETARAQRESSLTPVQRELENEYAEQMYLWEKRAELYHFLPRFVVGTFALAASLPLLLLGVYFILAWVVRGFIS